MRWTLFSFLTYVDLGEIWLPYYWIQDQCKRWEPIDDSYLEVLKLRDFPIP